MTPRENASADHGKAAPPQDPTYSRRAHDAALCALVVGTLLLASWLRGPAVGEVVVELADLPPARINVARAPWYEWTLLDGIGEARGRWIVRYREENGPFLSLDDLRVIPRLPSGWLERAAPLLEFSEGPETSANSASSADMKP